MEYEAFCSLLENVPGQKTKIQAYDIITAVSDYVRPALPWTVIMQIRRKGYVSNSKLHDILTRGILPIAPAPTLRVANSGQRNPQRKVPQRFDALAQTE